jgi:myo-inositol 2-dehydrogenase / D-chiro-inositol 1-dehydrogenase
MSVRIALIGAGVMGADHARTFSEDIPDAELRVVSDTAREWPQ